MLKLPEPGLSDRPHVVGTAPGGLRMALQPRSKLLLRGDLTAPGLRKRLANAGIALPARANEATGPMPLCIWMSPTACLISGEDLEPLIGVLRTALTGLHADLILVSDGFAMLEIEGERAADLLATSSGVDFSAHRFAPGQSATTLVAGIVATICRPGPGLLYELYVDRSHARYLEDWLADATLDLARAVPSTRASRDDKAWPRLDAEFD